MDQTPVVLTCLGEIGQLGPFCGEANRRLLGAPLLIDWSIKIRLARKCNDFEGIMPRIGMEVIRRSALVAATIDEVGRAGTLDVTVSQIARRAGVSSSLAHHYFGSKEKILLAAMRHILNVYRDETRELLRAAKSPRQRIAAVLEASFSARNFRPEVASAWLSLFAIAQTSAEAKHLLHIYHRRLHTNLVSGLKCLAGSRAEGIASSTAALIDGFYLRRVLQKEPISPIEIVRALNDHVDSALRSADAGH